MQAGDEVYITVFVHSAYSIETFQGMRIVPSFANEESGKLFTVKVEPENLLLGPSYPVMDGNWMQKIVIRIKASEDAKPGNYSIGFNAIVPEPVLRAEWGEKYLPKYVSGGGIFSVSQPRLKINLSVG